MNKCKLLAGLVVSSTFAATAAGAADFLQFQGAIGADPVGGITAGAPVANMVRGVSPGGRPWILRSFAANIAADGRIHAKGRGLLLGGSDNIGFRGGVTQVAVSLSCQTAAATTGVPATFAFFNSPAVDLDLAGNFEVKGSLTPVPTNPCTLPVLLIRNAPAGVLGAWFAAGIVGSEQDDD